MALAGSFFSQREINREMGIDSASSLWEWVRSGASAPVSGAANAVPMGPHVVYRGQATAAHGLSSSLYRLCRNVIGASVTEADLATTEGAVLDAMREEGLGRRMTDGELLMVLQHHAIPTRLIDVSAEPTEALFFAVDRDDATDGSLFIVDVQDSKPLHLGRQQELPWENAAWGTRRTKAGWSGVVGLVDAQDLDPRMRAQQGKFLVGVSIDVYLDEPCHWEKARSPRPTIPR